MALLARGDYMLLSYHGFASKGEIKCSYLIMELLSLAFLRLSPKRLVRVKSPERESGESETRHFYQGEIICSFTIMALVIRGYNMLLYYHGIARSVATVFSSPTNAMTDTLLLFSYF